jgi:hypothetical protein
MTHIPTNLCFVFPYSPRKKPVVWRQEGSIALQLGQTMPRSFAVWPTTSLLLLAASQFASPTREDDQFWDRFFDAALGPYGRPHQSLLELHDFQTAYGMDPGGVQRGPGRGIPRDGQGRGSMYEGPEWGFRQEPRQARVAQGDSLGVLDTTIKMQSSKTPTGPHAKRPNSTGSTHELKGCRTLCDSGYHEWQETMNGYKYPTTCTEGLWSAR